MRQLPQCVSAAVSSVLYGERLGLLLDYIDPEAQHFIDCITLMFKTTSPMLYIPPAVLRQVGAKVWRDHVDAWDGIFSQGTIVTVYLVDSILFCFFYHLCRKKKKSFTLAVLRLGDHLKSDFSVKTIFDEFRSTASSWATIVLIPPCEVIFSLHCLLHLIFFSRYL